MISHGFIFARKGSKGIPRKNIKSLLGKPLIQYSIEVASQISGIDKVFVSTDDNDIAKLSKSFGAIVIDRPVELALDNSPELYSWKHAINWVKNKYGNFQEFISLPATSPLRTVKDVEDAMFKKYTTGADICVAVTPASHSPYFNMVKESNNNLVELVNKPNISIYRRQDAPQVFEVTTIVYVASVDFIIKNNNLFDGNVTSIEVPRSRAIDIDSIHDFNFAESILKNDFNQSS